MANYYLEEINRARNTEKVSQIMDDLDFADITKDEYFVLIERAEERIAELMTA